MATRKRIFVNHHYYHVFNRGVNKQKVFISEGDYPRLLELLQYYSFDRLPLRYSHYRRLPSTSKANFLRRLHKLHTRRVYIISYCLMPNHYHLLLRQQIDGGIPRFVSDVQNGFTKYLNLKHDRSGPIFQGPFRAIHIKDDSQFLHLSRYIHLNPYSDRLVKTTTELRRYPWSSLIEYLNPTSPGICEKKLLLELAAGPEAYTDFVLNSADYQRQLAVVKTLALEEIPTHPTGGY